MNSAMLRTLVKMPRTSSFTASNLTPYALRKAIPNSSPSIESRPRPSPKSGWLLPISSGVISSRSERFDDQSLQFQLEIIHSRPFQNNKTPSAPRASWLRLPVICAGGWCLPARRPHRRVRGWRLHVQRPCRSGDQDRGKARQPAGDGTADRHASVDRVGCGRAVDGGADLPRCRRYAKRGTAELARLGKFRFERLLRRELATIHGASAWPRRWRFVAKMPVDSMGKRRACDLAMLFDKAL